MNGIFISLPTTIRTISELSSLLRLVTGIIVEDGVGSSDNNFITLEFSRFPLLKTIEIGNGCFKIVREFVIDGLPSLESVKIGNECFGIYFEERDDGICRITNCPNLTQLEIGNDSFGDFKSFEISYLNSLQSIKIGDNCFECADFSLKGE